MTRILRQFAFAVMILFAAISLLAQDAAKPSESPAEQQVTAPQPAPVQLSEKEMKKLFVKRVRPEYPPLAQQARIVGKVKLRLLIGADGNLKKYTYVYGHPMLGPAAVRAAQESKYRAYLVDGKPVDAEGEVVYEIP